MAIVAVGTDIVQCVRIANMIHRHGEQFLERVYTSAEIDHCCEQPDSTGAFAKHWAVKESVFSALRCQRRGVRWTDIEVTVCPKEGHTVRLHGNALLLSRQAKVDRIHVAMGGCRTQVISHVILWRDDT